MCTRVRTMTLWPVVWTFWILVHRFVRRYYFCLNPHLRRCTFSWTVSTIRLSHPYQASVLYSFNLLSLFLPFRHLVSLTVSFSVACFQFLSLNILYASAGIYNCMLFLSLFVTAACRCLKDPCRVDNDNHFASFFAKKWLQTIIVFREKIMPLSR